MTDVYFCDKFQGNSQKAPLGPTNNITLDPFQAPNRKLKQNIKSE